MNKMITALKIKYALMYYFRFNRQCICATECNNSDVLVITKNGMTIDIEVKINKYDLWKGEAKKNKHRLYHKTEDSLTLQCFKTYMANKFYICVPISLEEEAIKWAEETNPKYGIIIYNSYYSISILKSAKKLHNYKSESLKNDIMMRVCSENIGLIERRINE